MKLIMIQINSINVAISVSLRMLFVRADQLIHPLPLFSLNSKALCKEILSDLKTTLTQSNSMETQSTIVSSSSSLYLSHRLDGTT